MSFNSLLNISATIKAKTESTSSDSGGLTTSWVSTSGVACAIMPGNSTESQQYAKETGITTLDMYYPNGTTIAHTSLIVPESGDYASRTFHAVSKPTGCSRDGIGWRISIQEVTGDGI